MNLIKSGLKLITIMTLLGLTVHSKSVPIVESTIKPGVIYLDPGNFEPGSFITVTTNISLTCLVKYDCTQTPAKCGTAIDISWLTPRELVEYQIKHGHNSARLRFTQSKIYIEKNKYFLVKSQLNITDVGAIHEGRFTCTHDLSKFTAGIDLDVRGLDIRGKCNYADQCLSYNCYKNQCKCHLNEVYVKNTDQCYPVAKYNDECSHNEQCSFTLGKDAKCVNNRCGCSPGFTKATLALGVSSCLKIAKLNDNCESSDQCSKNDQESFCSVKKRCECRTGYRVSDNGCKSFKKCYSSQFGDNTNYTQGSCDQYQWCSPGDICLCKPSYGFNGDGSCDLLRTGPQNDEMWYERYGYYIIGVLGAFLLMALFMIAFQVKKNRKQSQTQDSQSSSSREHLRNT